MTGKRYYIATLGDWQRHASRFANSHWLALDATTDAEATSEGDSVEAQHAVPLHALGLTDATRILVLVEADEGAHLALEDDPAFEPLPHPLAQQPVSVGAQAALAAVGVTPGATTFDAAEAAARVHPLLRHRVF
jgi:hypothetical protein